MLTIAALYLGLAGVPQACPGSFIIAPRAVGPLTLGEPVAMLKTYHDTSERVFKDGRGGGVTYAVAVCDGSAIDATAKGRPVVIHRLSTTSPIFHTKNGAHVGMTVAELRQLYPNGKLDIFIDERAQGAVANFDTETGIVFGLDGAEVPHGCYDYDTDCTAQLKAFRSIDVHVQAP